MFAISREEVRRNTIADHLGYRWVRKDIPLLDLARTFRATRKNLPTPREYLRKVPDNLPWVRTWLKYGRAFQTPHRQECLDLKKGGLLLEEGQCYLNSLVASQTFRQIWENARYAEGFVILPTGPHRHAWVTVGDRVIDPTWEDAHWASYFGVDFEPEFAQAVMESVDWGSMTGHWNQCSEQVIKHLESRD